MNPPMGKTHVITRTFSFTSWVQDKEIDALLKELDAKGQKMTRHRHLGADPKTRALLVELTIEDPPDPKSQEVYGKWLRAQEIAAHLTPVTARCRQRRNPASPGRRWMR